MLLTAHHSLLLLLSCLLSLSSALGTYHYNLFKSQPSAQHHAGKPMGRHKNHCAYVVEKSVSFTMQDGVAPYVKAEYNKCSWGQKCPALMYRLLYKPLYKVAYKTVTELEWRCCPGFSGFGCKIGPMHKGPMPMQKGPVPVYKGPMPMYKGPMPMHKGPMPMQKGPMPMHKGPMPMPMPMHKGPIPMPMHKGPMHMQKGPMPPFKGPMPPFKGPMPPFKGVMPQSNSKGNHWGQGPMNTRHQNNFGQNGGSYPNPSYPSIPNSQDPLTGHPDSIPDHHDSSPEHHDPTVGHHDLTVDHHDPSLDPHDPLLDHIDPSTDHLNPIPDHDSAPEPHPIRVNVEAELLPEEQTTPTDSHPNYDQDLDSVTVERLDRMEDDVQRLSRGLETLRGTVTGLEDSLRASLREDANRMLSALLSAAPGSGPHLALTSSDSTVGFGDLPGVAPDTVGLDGMQFPGLSELAGKVAELRGELQAKTIELEELRGTVLGHDGALMRLTNGTHSLTGSPLAPDAQKAIEKMVDTKLSGARTAIFGGFERRMETAENRCEERAGEVRRQCQRDQMHGQSQLEDTLDGSMANLSKQVADLQAQIQSISPEDGCCHGVSGLTERVVLLEQSMDGLNQSQKHLKAELGGHKDHVEGMLEGRLGYVEAKLNITLDIPGRGGPRGVAHGSMESRLEEKLKVLEERLFAAVEELGNATAPALLEGQVVPTLETEVESLRKRVEVDVDRVQRQLSNLELLCSSTCAPVPTLEGTTNIQLTKEDVSHVDNHTKVLGQQAERLNRLNATLTLLLQKVAEREEAEAEGLYGEVTLLKVSVRSVNRTLFSLKDSLGTVVQEVNQANATWQDREERLAQQVRGVVQLVGKQASMLSSGEKRLARLKAELQELRRRLAGELQGCRSAALGVQKEVTEVGGRVARVEGQCGGLQHLAEDLERIRGELEGTSDGYLTQFNSTLANHSQQLSELREGLTNCTGNTRLAQALGDLHIVPTHKTSEEHIEVAAEPRGDQFVVPIQPKELH